MAKEAPPPVSRPGGPAGTGQAHAHALAFLMTVIIATSFPLGEHFFITQYTTLRIGATRVQAYGYSLPAIVLLVDLALGKPAPPLMTVPGLAIVLAASLVVQRGAIREFRD